MLDVKSGLQRMNDELTYSVILNVLFKKSKLKTMKNVQMRKRVYVVFFSEEILDNSQVSAIQNNRNRCWLFGLQQNFDIGTAFLFGLV